MSRQTYIADGTTVRFYFSFPFFANHDISVKMDDAPPIKGYVVRGNAEDEGSGAEYPFNGGSIEFDKAPKIGTKIEIIREIQAIRNTDFQPTQPIEPVILNQEFNLMLDLLRQLTVRFNAIDAGNFADLVSKSEVLLGQLREVSGFATESDIELLQNQITQISNRPNGDPGAVEELRNMLEDLSAHVSSLMTIPADADYVVESSEPGATPWYRKYKSGWVEQGGDVTVSHPAMTSGSASFIYPVTMLSSNYHTNVTIVGGVAGWADGDTIFSTINANGGGVTHYGVSNVTNLRMKWEIKGMAV